MRILYFIIGCIVGAIGGAGVALAFDLFSCVCYIVTCGSSDSGIENSAILFFVIMGALIGGSIGIYNAMEKEKQEKLEKQMRQSEAIKEVIDADYNAWSNKLNSYYNAIGRKIYCNCSKESLSQLYNSIWELEKEKKESKERPYEQTFLKVWTEHVNQLRNNIIINIDKPGYYALSMILRSMTCLRSAYKEEPRFNSAVNILEELLNKAQNKIYYIKFLQYGDCVIKIDNIHYEINIENRIEELHSKIKIILNNTGNGDFGEYFEKINPELSHIIDYAAQLMWCVACKKPFDQNMFNMASSIFDAYTARCKIDNSCTTWKYEQKIYNQTKNNNNQDERPKCLLNIHVEHLLALIYAKNSVGGASLVSKEKKRIAEWINEIIDIGCEEEGFLLASGLAWMGLYDLEREVLRHLFDRKVKFEIEYQDRLSFLEGGGNTNIKIHDVEGMEGFLFDSSVEGWNKDAYDMFFRKLEMTHKSLEYSLMISKWTKTLPLASGQEISQGQMEEAFEDLVKDFDNEIILSREPAKAVNLANVEYKSPFIFRFTSERNRCVTMLFSSDKFGRNLNISILTMFTPEKELDNEEMKKYALAIKDNIYVESFRESICQVVDQLIKEKVTIYDEEEVPRKIFS